MSIADQFGDRRQWRQGFWGDLAFRLRLFMAPQRLVDVLNQVEGAAAAVRTVNHGDQPGALERLADVDRGELLASAEVELGAAAEELRCFVFGRSSLRDAQFDGPEECALVIDSDDSDLIVRPDGTVWRNGVQVPKSTILTYRRPL